MKRRLAAAVTIVGAVGALAIPAFVSASSASAAGVCVNAHLDINGTVQDINQCLPPS